MSTIKVTNLANASSASNNIVLAADGTVSLNVLTQANTGGYLRLASGTGGIQFNGDTAAGNSLDDYEEGTWTPEYRSAAGSFASITYDAAIYGAYTKIGRVVHAHGFLRTDGLSIGTASGNLEIHGLPFAGLVGGGMNASGSIGFSQDFLGEEPSAVLLGSSPGTFLNLYYRNAADGNVVITSVTDLDTGTNDNSVYFSITYFAA